MKSIYSEIKRCMPKEEYYDNCTGYGEDNNMTSYRYDILYTRMKFKKIGDYKGMKRPYRFYRKDFRWVEDKYGLDLMGKLVLIDKDKNKLISDDSIWISLQSFDSIENTLRQYSKKYPKMCKRLIEDAERMERLKHESVYTICK